VRLIRWKAVAPLALAVLVVALCWWLFLDWSIEWAIEYTGAEIVGARVDVGSVRTSLRNGSVRVRGLEVTDPDQPMTNLVQADEIVAQVRVLPLLEKKIVIDTMAVRGVRFGTPRRFSGAIARQSPTTGRVARAISDWANRIKIPPLNLRGLGGVVDVSRISADSLRTVQQARSLSQQSDSLRRAWQSQLSGLDPQPQVDSARALIARLKAADVRALGLAGTRDLISTSRGSVSRLTQVTGRIAAFEAQVKAGGDSLRSTVGALSAARQADYAYARGLVNLPSLETPDLSPALFGGVAVERIKRVLYWLNLAAEYVPPGLDPRRQPGPSRVRAPGTTVEFPRARQYPGFLLQYAAADAEVGGTGTAAGHYAAKLTGLTTAPSLYGRPTRLTAQRSGAAQGPSSGSVYAVLNHVTAPVSDSVAAALDGVALPAVALAAAGARLIPGSGAVQLRLTRSGENLTGSMTWRSSSVRWVKEGADTALPPSRLTASVGSTQWAHDLLWRTVSSLSAVEVEVRIGGRVSEPSLGVSSNVGREVAQALRREVGAEVARQEQRLRARVDQMVAQQVQDAQGKVADAQAQVEGAVAAKRAELEQVRAEMEAELKRLTSRVPIRIP
jgi:uncharacterized protein (TIGR03545 family)